MKLELIDATPIRAALGEITELEGAQLNGDVRLALGNARALVAKALDDAANPRFSDGVSVDDYAKMHDPPLTPDGVRKRIQRGRLAAEKRGGRYFIIVDAA